jgi:hypothetical protein
VTDEEVLYKHVLETIGDTPENWPGGWPSEIEAALIDAIFSIRARYGNRSKRTGVYGAVARWREHRKPPADDLRILAATPEPQLRDITNSGRLAGRTKAQVVLDAAKALVEVGVVHSVHLKNREDEARKAYLSVKGCGPVTWAYFRMLLGHDDVKADTWVTRFVQDKLPGVTTHTEVSRLVHRVASRLEVDARQLDHAIWRYRRRRPSRSTS